MALFFLFSIVCALFCMLYGVRNPTAFGKNMTQRKLMLSLSSVIVLLVLAAAITKEEKPAQPKQDTQAKQAGEQRLDQAAEEYVKTATEAGLIVKIIPEVNQVFVEPSIWHALNYETKERTAVLLARYCGMKNGMDSRLVYVKDKYSGKELAALGLFGFMVSK